MHYTTRCNTQSSAPEDVRDQRPKQVEMIGIINKPLLLHLFGVYIIYDKCVIINNEEVFDAYLNNEGKLKKNYSRNVTGEVRV